MAKVYLINKDKVKITIEGAPKELAEIISQFGGSEAFKLSEKQRKIGGTARFMNKGRATPMGLVGNLIDGGFFKKFKDIAATKSAIQEMGRNYPITSLSPTLLRFVRKGQLRRKKEKNKWLYFN